MTVFPELQSQLKVAKERIAGLEQTLFARDQMLQYLQNDFGSLHKLYIAQLGRTNAATEKVKELTKENVQLENSLVSWRLGHYSLVSKNDMEMKLENETKQVETEAPTS